MDEENPPNRHSQEAGQHLATKRTVTKDAERDDVGFIRRKGRINEGETGNNARHVAGSDARRVAERDAECAIENDVRSAAEDNASSPKQKSTIDCRKGRAAPRGN